MIVVTTPTGRIGSKVVQLLLASGGAVRVIVRDAARLATDIRAQVDVVEGSHADATVVAKATRGADRYFLLMPPSFAVQDIHAYYMEFAEALQEPIRSGVVKRVVCVSNCGRGYRGPAGVVTAALAKDEALERSGVAYRALWCPGFYENLLLQAAAIRQGEIAMPGAPDLKTRFCATQDIAGQAVRLLLDGTWSGAGGIGVLGPEDLSWNQIAAITAEVLGRPVRFRSVPYETYQAQLIQRGASPTFAADMTSMFIAKDQGLDNVEPRNAENSTPTSFRAWCEAVLKPAVQASATR